MQKKTPSRLSARQQRTLLAVVALGVFMVADTLYLLTNRLADALDSAYFAVTDISLPKFYQGMVLSHTGVGLLLVVLAMGFVAWHLPAVWAQEPQAGHLHWYRYADAGHLTGHQRAVHPQRGEQPRQSGGLLEPRGRGGFSPSLLLGAPPPLAVEALRAELSHRARSGGWAVGASRGATRVDL